MFISLHSKDHQSALIAQLSHAWAGPAHHQLCQCLCNHGDCVAVTSQAYGAVRAEFPWRTSTCFIIKQDISRYTIWDFNLVMLSLCISMMMLAFSSLLSCLCLPSPEPFQHLWRHFELISLRSLHRPALFFRSTDPQTLNRYFFSPPLSFI